MFAASSSTCAVKPSKKRPYSSFNLYEEIDSEELGAETEAEKHLKALVQKQLNKKLSVEEQFAQHRTFSHPSTYTSPTQLIKGACTLEKFKEIEQNEELHQELQRCGLSEDEIANYLLYKSGKTKGNCKVDPDMWTNYINGIKEKIKAHNEELLKPQTFKNVKKLTRHEMDIEKTLYAGCTNKTNLSTLVSVLEENHPTEIDSAFTHIKNLSKKLLTLKKKKLNAICNKQNLTSQEITDNFQYDCNIHHVIIPLGEDEVKEKRLNIDEIRKLPRFENYELGNPSKVLYIKNLHKKITINELRSLFGLFEEENKLPIEYRLCTGRMKGQAFLKFSSVDTAGKALKHANGYMLREKPMIIEFGHQK